MIDSKETLQFYLDADKFAMGKTKRHPRLFRDEIWRFEILLRKCEYFTNTKTGRLLLMFSRFRLRRLSIKLGFSIPLNVFGPGMKINHYGTIVINGNSKIGRWCDLHPGVCVGDNSYISMGSVESHQVPTIGNYVYIGPGAKLFGKIEVGDGVRIGANCVVNRDIAEGMVAFGNPVQVKETKHALITTADKSFEEKFLKAYPQYKKYLL